MNCKILSLGFACLVAWEVCSGMESLRASAFLFQTSITRRRTLYPSTSESLLSWTTSLRAGFGGGFGSSSKKKKKSVSKKKKNALQELSPPSSVSTSDSPPQLDKWGLPPPTTEDIFPPMPPGTELLSVEKGQAYTLDHVEQAMQHNLPLHNLRKHFQSETLTEILNDSPSVVDREPMQLKFVHQSPPVLVIENFLTPQECEEIESVAIMGDDDEQESSSNVAVKVNSATFANAVSTRTSTSWFALFSAVPKIIAKFQHILGISPKLMEEPQIVRYQTGQEFSWHYDEVPPPQLNNGGQRVATILVYLNTVERGGGTMFRDLQDGDGNRLTVQPVQGRALLFFPALADGTPDDRTLHKGEVAEDEKRIVQVWIHERDYSPVLPPGNSQAEAQRLIDEASRELGLIQK